MKPLTFGRSLPPVARRVTVRVSRGTPASAHDLLPAVSWMLFGGKGGVGKTTTAAAYALDLSRSAPLHRVLLVSTDPAHSLEDVFGCPLDSSSLRGNGAPENLTVREIDAAASFDDFRQRYAGFVDEAFARVGAVPEASGAMRQIMDLAPPGVDEVMAIADVAELLVGSPDAYDTIVSDTAPTGHVLRLLQTPALLKEWTQALMAILLKYREVVPAGPLASLLVQLSKRLRALDARLHDSGQTRFVLVTRPASLPREETIRLRAALDDLKIDVGGVVVNATGAGTCRACRSRARVQAEEIAALRQGLGRRARYAIIEAPAVMPPPHGARALSAWATTWQRL
jgi:arsenite-transporting ATPase